MNTRTLSTLIPALPTSDGAGVKLRRTLGARPSLRLDPFLLLDEFFSDDAKDYIAGFPAHPHRGFQTVTYMLDGHMLHEDHMGNRGDLVPGAVQWMSAGSGVIHSEMPQQQQGRMRGFQLWINLPASEKMTPPAYRDIPPGEIPLVVLGDDSRLKVIAGNFIAPDGETSGPIQGLTTDPLYLDVDLHAGATLAQTVDAAYNALVYVYEGQVEVGGQPVAAPQAGILSPGARIVIESAGGARFLLLAGKPLGEPIAQYGPFVMNTAEEIDRALRDYREGRLTALPPQAQTS